MNFSKNTIIDTILTLIIIGGIILGGAKDHIFFIIPILALIALIVIRRIRIKRFIKSEKERLREEWGKGHNGKVAIKNIRQLFDFLPKEKPGFFIDEITWRDLNMDSIFLKMDHTQSLAGMNFLYNLLRIPLFNKEELIHRNNIINYFRNNKDISIDIQWPLSRLGKEEGANVFFFFRQGLDINTDKLILYRILSILPFITLALFAINPPLAISSFTMVLFVNAIIYQNNKNRIFYELEAFNYLGSMTNCLKTIDQIKGFEINGYKDKAAPLLKDTASIRKNISKLKSGAYDGSDIQVIKDFLNMIVLRETIIFYNTVKLINKNRENYIEIYKLLGEIDCFISIASYRESLNYFCEPNLLEDRNLIFIEATNLYHPLLDKPVPYNISQRNLGALITGSNASGKSTFLRTIGVNALLSQTLYMALAEKYSGNYFKLLTSIGMADSIEEGDSYFMAEAKSLKRIIDSIDIRIPTLCILDEIFRGTNTLERINAGKEVLDYMVDRNVMIFAATHDLELTILMEGKLTNYHFQEDIKEKDIEFDYILRKGPCTSRNAIAILRYLDYPPEIYENAEKRVLES